MSSQEVVFIPARFKDGYGPVGAWFLLFKAAATSATGFNYMAEGLAEGGELHNWPPYGEVKPIPTCLRNHLMMIECYQKGDGPIFIHTDKAIAKLEELGAQIKEISLPTTDYAVAAYYIVAPAEASSNLARYDGVKYGYRAADAESLMDMDKKTRAEGFVNEVKRRIMVQNHTRTVDAARLLDMPYMCVHTPADNCVTTYLQGLLDKEKPDTVGEVINIIENIPEYREVKMKAFISMLSILLLVSCAMTQPQQTLQPQEIVVTVKSADSTEVKVDDGEERIAKAMEVSNPEGKLSSLSFICKDKAFVKIFSGLSVADVTRFWNDIVVIENNTTIREVHVFINSPGGGAFDGLALADEIERARNKGFKIIAHASGIIASAAVPVFAVCDVRLAAPGTIFMVHEAALWKWPGRETASDIESQNELMKLLRDRYIGKLVDNSNLSKAKWEELEKKTTWFSANKAFDWGLVDKIE